MKRILLTLISWAGFAIAFWGASISAQAQPIDTLWSRSFMPCETFDAILAIAAFPTGGEIVAGTTECVVPCGYVQRISSEHDTLWTLRLRDQGVHLVADILVRENGQILFIGNGFGDVGGHNDDRTEIGMIDSIGNLVWIDHNEETTDFWVGSALCPSGGESFVSASYSLDFSWDDDILVQHHLDEDSITWSLTISSPVHEKAVDIEPFGDGYVLLGDRLGLLIVRGLDSTGGIAWTEGLGTGFDAESGGLTVIGDSLIAVTGTFQLNSGSGRTQAYVGILDGQGEPQSEWISDTNSTYEGWDCGLTSSGKIILAGAQYLDDTRYDGYLACFSLACSLEWSLTTGGTSYDWFNTLLVRDDTDIVAGGVTFQSPQCSPEEDWLVGFGESSSVTPSWTSLSQAFEVASCFPNPCNQGITILFQLRRPQQIEIVIYDILGRTRFSQTSNFAQGNNSLHLPLIGFASGKYYALFAGVFGASEALSFTVVR